MTSNKLSSRTAQIRMDLAEQYESKPLVRALAAFVSGSIPVLGAIPSALDAFALARIGEVIQERQKAFFDELAKDDIYLTDDLIESDDFLHSFMITFAAAQRTRKKEKIQRFARLLINGVRLHSLQSSHLEEFTSILEDLSDREFDILLMIKEVEQSAKLGAAGKTTWNSLVEKANSRYEINFKMLSALVTRLDRTGLVQSGTSYGTQAGEQFTRHQPITSALFDEFMDWIQIEAD